MTQVTAEMQEIIDRLGWAENRTEVTSAAIALARHVDARLTALEAKSQAPDYWRKWAAAEVEIKTAELDAARADRDNLAAGVGRLTDEVRRLTTERNALAAQLDDLRNVNAGLRKHDVYLDNLVKSLQSQIAADIDDIAGLRKENAVLRRDYGIKRRQYDEVQAALKALQDDLR